MTIYFLTLSPRKGTTVLESLGFDNGLPGHPFPTFGKPLLPDRLGVLHGCPLDVFAVA